MIKKVIGWSLFALFVGALVFGGIYRTQAKAGEVTAGNGRNAQGNFETGNQAHGNSQAESEPAEDPVGAQTQDWQTFIGRVTSVDASALVITLEDGSQLEVANRPWSFAQEAGAVFTSGDSVRLTGFYDSSGIFEVATLENQTSGLTLAIRDESGRPGWAGRGRGGRQ